METLTKLFVKNKSDCVVRGNPHQVCEVPAVECPQALSPQLSYDGPNCVLVLDLVVRMLVPPYILLTSPDYFVGIGQQTCQAFAKYCAHEDVFRLQGP